MSNKVGNINNSLKTFILNKNKGFTLIELLISVTILSTVVMSIYGIMDSSMIFFNKSITTSQNENSLMYFETAIIKDLEILKTGSLKIENKLVEGKLLGSKSNEIQNIKIYHIGNINYYKIFNAEKGGVKFYNVIREDEKGGKIILLENVLEEDEAFKISYLNKLYTVNIIIRDKNFLIKKDKVFNFSVAEKIG